MSEVLDASDVEVVLHPIDDNSYRVAARIVLPSDREPDRVAADLTVAMGTAAAASAALGVSVSDFPAIAWTTTAVKLHVTASGSVDPDDMEAGLSSPCPNLVPEDHQRKNGNGLETGNHLSP